MDTDGNFTCVANNGASTFDYNICSILLFEKCTYFNVENRTESIHFPLFCQFIFKMKEISCNKVNYNTYTFYRFSRKYTRYVWSDAMESRSYPTHFWDILKKA